MKKIMDYVRDAFKGQVETITATQLRAHPGECMTQASLGKTFCIKRKGKIVAFLVPPGEANVVHQVLSDGSCPTIDPKNILGGGK
jgi:hypothetical protein